MNASIKIDLQQGIVEASGSEEFVNTIYNDFKNEIFQRLVQNNFLKAKTEIKKSNLPGKKIASSKPIKKQKKTNPTEIKDLDLSGNNSSQSLKEFYSKYAIKDNLVRNVVFVYYLKNIKKINEVSIDHIFTCYRNIEGLKIPGNLEQSIRDSRSSKNWLDYNNLSDIKLTVHGINYIEHDLESTS